MDALEQVEQRLKALGHDGDDAAPGVTDQRPPAESGNPAPQDATQQPPADPPPHEPAQPPPADPAQDDPPPTAAGDVTTLPAWAQVHIAKLDSDNRALRGKVKAEGPRHAQEIRTFRDMNMRLQQELAARDERIAQLQQQSPATPAALDNSDDLAASVFNEQEREEMGSLAPLVARAAKRISDKSLEQVRQENRKVQQQLFVGQLSAHCPHWQGLNDDPAFNAWLNEADPVSRQARRASLNTAVANGDAAWAAEFFNTYLTTTGRAPAAAPANPRKPAAPPVASPASQVAPQKGGPQGPSSTAGRIYTLAEVRALNNALNQNRYSAEDAERIGREIDQAMNDGRVRG
jgi:hypothetical protein